MSLHHGFSDKSQLGFITSVDPRAARRQFHVSLGVAVVLMVAIGGSALAIHPAIGFDQASQRAAIADAAAMHRHDFNAGLRGVQPTGS